MRESGDGLPGHDNTEEKVSRYLEERGWVVGMKNYMDEAPVG